MIANTRSRELCSISKSINLKHARHFINSSTLHGMLWFRKEVYLHNFIINTFFSYCLYSCFPLFSGKLANGYAFYYPHSMGAKQAAKVCLAIDQHLLPAVIEITFENKICEGTTCNPRTISQGNLCYIYNYSLELKK